MAGYDVKGDNLSTFMAEVALDSTESESGQKMASGKALDE